MIDKYLMVTLGESYDIYSQTLYPPEATHISKELHELAESDELAPKRKEIGANYDETSYHPKWKDTRSNWPQYYKWFFEDHLKVKIESDYQFPNAWDLFKMGLMSYLKTKGINPLEYEEA